MPGMSDQDILDFPRFVHDGPKDFMEQQRAKRIVLLAGLLRVQNPAKAPLLGVSVETVARHLEDSTPHSSNSQAFVTLFAEDRSKADAIALDARNYLDWCGI